MATITLQGTTFTLSVFPKQKKNAFWIKTEIGVRNEYISYSDIGENLSFSEWEELLFGMSRLLAGGYEREHTLFMEKAGLAVDFFAYTEAGAPVSRELRRKKDCMMAVRFLLRDSKGESFLGGVYSLILHRADIEAFSAALRKEWYEGEFELAKGKGEYLFVGVSPLGYVGCNYWYVDPTDSVKAGEYVWVRMGRSNREQIVYVDSVRRFTRESAPYNPEKVKQVLRKATQEEMLK